MEINGISLDKIYLQKLELELKESLLKLTNEIYIIAGKEFNIASPKQIGEVLFEELNLSKKNPKKPNLGNTQPLKKPLLN